MKTPIKTIIIPRSNLITPPDAVHNYVPVVYGIEARVYKDVMRGERATLYATPDHSEKVRDLYRSGLFSVGRPGIIGEK